MNELGHWQHAKVLPPVTVRVANLYSATENPALLWAVTRSWYQVAGSRSKTTKFPPGLTLLDTWFHSIWFLKKRKSNNQKLNICLTVTGPDAHFVTTFIDSQWKIDSWNKPKENYSRSLVPNVRPLWTV